MRSVAAAGARAGRAPARRSGAPRGRTTVRLVVRQLTNSCHSASRGARRRCSQPLQVVGERAVAGLAQAARQAAVDHRLLAGVQADAGVLVDQLAHALEVAAPKTRTPAPAGRSGGGGGCRRAAGMAGGSGSADGILPAAPVRCGPRDGPALALISRGCGAEAAAARLAASIAEPHLHAEPLLDCAPQATAPADRTAAERCAAAARALEARASRCSCCSSRATAACRARPASDAWLQALIDALVRPVQPRRADRPGQPPPASSWRWRARSTASRASGEPALLLMLDIDHFKTRQRHPRPRRRRPGDPGRRPRRWPRRVRPMDTVARVGGEEFAIMLPNCPAAFGPTVAERMRTRVERAPVDDRARRARCRVTVSVGGAFAPQWVRSIGAPVDRTRRPAALPRQEPRAATAPASSRPPCRWSVPRKRACCSAPRQFQDLDMSP